MEETRGIPGACWLDQSASVGSSERSCLSGCLRLSLPTYTKSTSVLYMCTYTRTHLSHVHSHISKHKHIHTSIKKIITHQVLTFGAKRSQLAESSNNRQISGYSEFHVTAALSHNCIKTCGLSLVRQDCPGKADGAFHCWMELPRMRMLAYGLYHMGAIPWLTKG